jgi:hypothetical protein
VRGCRREGASRGETQERSAARDAKHDSIAKVSTIQHQDILVQEVCLMAVQIARLPRLLLPLVRDRPTGPLQRDPHGPVRDRVRQAAGRHRRLPHQSRGQIPEQRLRGVLEGAERQTRIQKRSSQRHRQQSRHDARVSSP